MYTLQTLITGMKRDELHYLQFICSLLTFVLAARGCECVFDVRSSLLAHELREAVHRNFTPAFDWLFELSAAAIKSLITGDVSDEVIST